MSGVMPKNIKRQLNPSSSPQRTRMNWPLPLTYPHHRLEGKLLFPLVHPFLRGSPLFIWPISSCAALPITASRPFRCICHRGYCGHLGQRRFEPSVLLLRLIGLLRFSHSPRYRPLTHIIRRTCLRPSFHPPPSTQ